MPKDDTAVLEARQEQAATSRRATLALLKGKKRAQREVLVEIPGEDGPEQASFLFRAISRREYDALIDEHPPTKAGVARGDIFNMDTFAPALLAKVIIEPRVPEDEWRDLWKSPDWSSGELNGLFVTAAGLCNSGFELVPTTGTD